MRCREKKKKKKLGLPRRKGPEFRYQQRQREHEPQETLSEKEMGEAGSQRCTKKKKGSWGKMKVTLATHCREKVSGGKRRSLETRGGKEGGKKRDTWFGCQLAKGGAQG